MGETTCHLHHGAAGLFLSVLSALALSVSALLVGSYKDVSVLVFLAFRHVVIFVLAAPSWLCVAKQHDSGREKTDEEVASEDSKWLYLEKVDSETRNSSRYNNQEWENDDFDSKSVCKRENSDMNNTERENQILKKGRASQEFSQGNLEEAISEKQFKESLEISETKGPEKEASKESNESAVESCDRPKSDSSIEAAKQKALNDKEIIPWTGMTSRLDCVLVVIRSCMGYLTAWCAFSAYRYLPLGDAAVLEYTAPIYSGILACVILKEPYGVVEICSTLVMLAGIVFISRPSFLWGESDAADPIGVTLAIATAVTSSINMLFGRKLKHVDSLFIIASVGLFSGIISWIVVLLTEGVSFPVTLLGWCAVVLNGVMAFTAAICCQVALKIENVVIVSLGRTSEPIFVFIWQVTILHVIPTWPSIVGSLLILSCILALSIKKCAGAQGNCGFDGSQDAVSADKQGTSFEGSRPILNSKGITLNLRPFNYLKDLILYHPQPNVNIAQKRDRVENTALLDKNSNYD